MNIVFCINKSYIKHFHVALTSLLKNNPKDEINIYLVSADICHEDLMQIGLEIDIILISISPETFNNFSVNEHITVETYFRLLIPELINVDKCLYLDSDIIVDKSITSLYDHDVDAYLLAAVAEKDSSHLNDKLKLPVNHKYFNAGVLLLNLKRIRENKTFERAIWFIRNNADRITYHDQCAINWAVHCEVLYLDVKYNLTKNFSCTMNDQNVVIFHFDGPIKPWHYNGRKELRQIYQKYVHKANSNYTKYERITLHQILSRHIGPKTKSMLIKLLRL